MATLSSERLQFAARREASWIVGACHQFVANRCPALAASIAFYSAFSLAPTLVMVIAVAGWFFGADAARGELFREVHNVLGNDAAAGITTIVANAHRAGDAGGIAAVISLSMLVIGASATFSSLHSALNIVWPPEGKRAASVFALVRVRLVSFSLVLGVAFLLIVSLVLDTTITFIGQWLWGNSPYLMIGNLLQLAVGLAVLAFAFAALLRFLPDANVQWRDALVGGLVAAVLFSAGKKLFALYLAHAGMATAFGAAGSLAVLLMWLYFSAAVLLLGAEFAAARAHLHDPRGAWGFLEETPPGSRAKLASVLAATTIMAPHDGHAVPRSGSAALPSSSASSASPASSASSFPTGNPADGTAEALAFAAPPLHAAADASTRHDGASPLLRRSMAKMEDDATYTAALTLVHTGRTAAAADRFVKRHPWSSVLLATVAAVAMTAAAVRRRA
ncbi:MAG: YihY/virulence factor BrkB family protein [Paraburkholderia sp.]|uniref:YihY/virulence factor BrkB family protein n=1 Tax=Paraburkholderia sp. TaxID=1926495 RepID=UPI001203BA01|nr:YihY/virulence factor BrkB family protein [Paraburkholderia sp.]TAM00764.1 MAG: YihY/virulence factor BrkB family protein [Paraburkholderia sp.]TAM28908.1 MAG: YihY/virulence factor BrkB family protein [Paraburkholderia sp.]